MKDFISKILLFISPLLIPAIVMEVMLRRIPNDYEYKREYLDKNSDKIETLILGSSHTFLGLNPEFFSTNTFNAAHVSQTLNYDYEIFKKYQNHFKSLRTVILPVSYFSLWEKLELGPEYWRVKNYIIYYKIKAAPSLTDFTEVLSNNPLYNVLRLFSYYVKGDPGITCTKSGWRVKHKAKKPQDLVETGKATAKRHTTKNINSEKNQNIFRDNVSILKSIIGWCNKNKVRVILFTPPAFETYRNNLNPEQLHITISTAGNIAAEYNNCIYLNLIADTNFVAKDFYDADHMSEIGAKKLSLILDRKENVTSPGSNISH